MPPVRSADARRSARLSSKNPVYKPAEYDRSLVSARYNLRHGISYLRKLSSLHLRNAYEGLRSAAYDGGWDVNTNLSKILAHDPVLLKKLLDDYNALMDQLDDMANHSIFHDFDFAALLRSTQTISDAIEAATKQE